MPNRRLKREIPKLRGYYTIVEAAERLQMTKQGVQDAMERPNTAFPGAVYVGVLGSRVMYLIPIDEVEAYTRQSYIVGAAGSNS